MKNKFFFILLVISFQLSAQPYKSFPMWNDELPVNERVNDLIKRLALAEKVPQLLHTAPAIERLGIPAYNWWNEGLHGIARTRFNVTVYPQAIANAATWNIKAVQKMADQISTEGRAIFNIAKAEGKQGRIYEGLTYWSPNINIFRDPRWGRGQETFGEDPFLTSSIGAAFVRGIQGSDPKYLKAAACAKHFAVHSGPEPTRHADNIHPTSYDLWDTYLPAFKKLVVDEKVAGVMCAYNRVYDQPCCASDLLMTDILRKQWNFKGYVTTDCWALNDFFMFHKSHPDAMTSAVDALLHTSDVECGVSVYTELVKAVEQKRIPESAIDSALVRLFTIRYQLGLFDKDENVLFSTIGESDLESKEHDQLALQMARESIVLLRNQNNLLPLSKNIKKIAVVGPNADNAEVQLANYNGFPTKNISVLEGIKNKLGKSTQVVYEQAVNYTDDTLFISQPFFETGLAEGKPGLKVEYFKNTDWNGTASQTIYKKEINDRLIEEEEPFPGFGHSNFSVRYSTTITPLKDEAIYLLPEWNDALVLTVNDSVLVDSRKKIAPRKINLKLQKGKAYHFRADFIQYGFDATFKIATGVYKKTNTYSLVNKLKDADAIVFVGGISPRLEGEQLDINVPGFNGGDRTSILLPAAQTRMLQALQRTGKPIIFVMMTGSAIATPWESKNIPAIINSWYGGQHAGTAIADVLFGDYNPAGRLPVTFYAADKDLPPFNDYNMQNRTYRYFNGTPLYPFGYGLSYTTFQYSDLKVPSAINTSIDLELTVNVTNTGKHSGDEVVQCYLSFPDAGGNKPLRALKAFDRIHLAVGETKNVTLKIKSEDIRLVNENGMAYFPEGKIYLTIGGGQPVPSLAGSGNILQTIFRIQP